MEYYFVVDLLTDVIETYVQRNQAPAPIRGKKFVLTDGVRLTFYLRLKEERGVTLQEVMDY
ncbi:hypothetical protein D3C85_1600570 [compost metagenome]